jgi:hypothetical protein
MKSIAFAASAIVLAAGLTGCATVTRGTTTQFSVTSTPPGASVKTSTGFACDATPCGMKMPRKTEFDVTVTKAGYGTKTNHVRSVVSGGGTAGMVGNAVLGGVIGIVVDASDGAMNDLTPNPLNVTLEAEAAQTAAAEPAPAAPTQAPTAKP